MKRLSQFRKATSMLFAALLAASFFHFHRQPKPKREDPYVQAITAELVRVAAQVGDYQHNPPRFTSADDDALYVTRAELDIHIAVATLRAYERRDAALEDVDSAIEQLERDVENEPKPAELYNN